MSSPASKVSLILTATNEPPGLSVAGVLDLPDVDAFARALDETARRVSGNVLVDFRGLRSSCAEGMLAMVRAARGLAADDRKLVASSLATPQRQFLKLARWDRAPGLVVTD